MYFGPRKNMIFMKFVTRECSFITRFNVFLCMLDVSLIFYMSNLCHKLVTLLECNNDAYLFTNAE